MIYLRLIYEFFFTGLFAFGGGLATLPFLYEIGEKTGWYGESDVLNMVAISESTPGPIGVNMATYTGFTVSGIAGGIVSTLALVAPSIIVIIIIAKFLQRFRQNPLVENVFSVLRPASVALILSAGASVAEITFINGGFGSILAGSWQSINIIAILLGAAIFTCYRVFKGHPIIYISTAAVVGILLKL